MSREEPNQPPDAVAVVADLRANGLRASTIHDRVRSGRWQRVLPGILVLHSGPPRRRQLRRAALAYGGPAALLSHHTAAELLGLRVMTRERVEITVAHGYSKRSTPEVLVHQSRARLLHLDRDGFPCTTAARTVVDVACNFSRQDDVRALVSDSVQRGLTTVPALLHEAERAPRHGRAFLNTALAEVAAGARSAAEARFLALMRGARLPKPELNVRIRLSGRVYIVDALWAQYRLVVEIDGATWHLNAVAWDRDLHRQNALQAAGFVVLRFPYLRLVHDPDGVIEEVRRTIARLAA